MVGFWRHRMAQQKIENGELRNYWGQDVILLGVVDEEPERKEKITQMKFQIENLNERILISKWHYPEYEYGDRLKIRGKLEEPQIFEGFNYQNYLAKEGIFGVMLQPEIELIEKSQGNFLKKFLISFKNKLNESLNKNMPFPQAPFLEALLFGEEGNISQAWKEKLNKTGTRHIAAVSGMNITIFTFLLSDFLLFLGFWRRQAFYSSIVLISLYILMIGAPASAVRAGIMAGLFLIAQHFGRLAVGSRTIVLAATIMLVLNPLLLISDIGFQLSFLAVMGLIYFQPILFDFFKKIPSSFQLRYNFSGTLSAQIFTFPLLIYNFGQISPISPLTNIFILPLLPFITISGFIFAVLGIVWERAGQILAWPVHLLLTYLIKTIDLFSEISWATLTLKNIHWIWLTLAYLILTFITWRLNEKQKLKFLNY